jgi:hypothetical protein
LHNELRDEYVEEMLEEAQATQVPEPEP